MALMLQLPSELEERLAGEAQRLGISLEQCAVQLLSEFLPTQERRLQSIALLQSWMDEPDPEEQQETGEYLIRALDEMRLSERPLFPPDLKGVTW